MNFDITWCVNEACKSKDQCGRHVKIAHAYIKKTKDYERRMSVADFNPSCGKIWDKDSCKYYFERETAE